MSDIEKMNYSGLEKFITGEAEPTGKYSLRSDLPFAVLNEAEALGIPEKGSFTDLLALRRGLVEGRADAIIVRDDPVIEDLRQHPAYSAGVKAVQLAEQISLRQHKEAA